MTVVKITTVSVVDAQVSGLEQRFAACRASMGAVPGFRGFELLRPTGGGDRYFVVSWWASDTAFCDWLAYGRETAHGTMRSDTRLMSELLEFEVVDLAAASPEDHPA